VHNGRQGTYGSVLAFSGSYKKLATSQCGTGSQEEADATVHGDSRIKGGRIFGILAIASNRQADKKDDQRKMQQYANGPGHVRFF
jgi:hypothetical protein